jgi:serpin B
VLVNAIYFKGLWKKQFDKRATTESLFWILNDSAIKVPMMRQKSEFGYMEDELAQVLELPYQDNRLSLIVILPQEKLSTVDSRLTYHNISKWISELSYEMVVVNLPSVKIKSAFNLNDSLVSMGMPDAFDDSKADFSGMDGTRELYISETIHQANIEVNEEGATATATTAVVMALRGLPQEYQFHANHPFIFLLRENTTGIILFIGRVLNPAG